MCQLVVVGHSLPTPKLRQTVAVGVIKNVTKKDKNAKVTKSGAKAGKK